VSRLRRRHRRCDQCPPNNCFTGPLPARTPARHASYIMPRRYGAPERPSGTFRTGPHATPMRHAVARTATARRSLRPQSRHPGISCPVSCTYGPWSVIRCSLRPGALHGLCVTHVGGDSTVPHAQGHNSLLPWPPDLLKTPIDAECSIIYIARGCGPIGRVFFAVGFETHK
jgi:hypothetical protein